MPYRAARKRFYAFHIRRMSFEWMSRRTTTAASLYASFQEILSENSLLSAELSLAQETIAQQVGVGALRTESAACPACPDCPKSDCVWTMAGQSHFERHVPVREGLSGRKPGRTRHPGTRWSNFDPAAAESVVAAARKHAPGLTGHRTRRRGPAGAAVHPDRQRLAAATGRKE